MAYDGKAFLYQPFLRGGSVQYDVDLSTVGCGCTAGVYAVNSSGYCSPENGEIDSDRPQCMSMEVMQANVSGFQTKMHPCANGTCDAVSQCQYNIAKDGEAKYGENAYGQGGSLIDTNERFTVKTEFVTRDGYMELWKVRSRLTQGANEMVVEAECFDYIGTMGPRLEGAMSLTFSTWRSAGRDASLADFEDKATCPKPSDSCDGAAVFSKITVQSVGFDEEPAPAEPIPEVEFKNITADSDMHGADFNFFLNGIGGQNLETEDRTLKISENNRAFLLDKQEDTPFWAYKHNYLGGSVSFDVDVSDVGCGCRAGVYLAAISDDDTNYFDPLDEGIKPQCSSIDLLEADIWAVQSASAPCSDGSCQESNVCKVKSTGAQVGPGPNYPINTGEPFNVKVAFWAEEGDDGKPSELKKIVTTIT